MLAVSSVLYPPLSQLTTGFLYQLFSFWLSVLFLKVDILVLKGKLFNSKATKVPFRVKCFSESILFEVFLITNCLLLVYIFHDWRRFSWLSNIRLIMIFRTKILYMIYKTKTNQSATSYQNAAVSIEQYKVLAEATSTEFISMTVQLYSQFQWYLKISYILKHYVVLFQTAIERESVK